MLLRVVNAFAVVMAIAVVAAVAVVTAAAAHVCNFVALCRHLHGVVAIDTLK